MSGPVPRVARVLQVRRRSDIEGRSRKEMAMRRSSGGRADSFPRLEGGDAMAE